MNKHIILLRGVNVSGSNIIKMADLKAALESLDYFTDVVTYIQSGNIVLSSKLGAKEVEEAIHKLIQTQFGYDVPVLAVRSDYLKQVLDNNPYDKEDDKKQYFMFLYSDPEVDINSVINAADYPNEGFQLGNKVIYFYFQLGAGKAKLSNNTLEKKLKITATTRNRNTVKKLIELSNS